MRRFVKLMFHPVTLIVVINLAWTTGLVFWILFFIERYRQIKVLAEQAGERPQEFISWAPLVVGILLMVFIFGGFVALILILAKHAIINRQMRNFLSFVSHELRTPLTSISLSLETMRDHDLTLEQRGEFIRNMLEDTGRLSRQIGGILDASRLQKGERPLHREMILLDRFVKEYASQRARSVDTGGHRLEVVTPDFCTVLGDREALRTCLDNLVRNAERYSPEGTRIRVCVRESGNWAVIEVEDEGIGIERRERKKIFNLFYRSKAGQTASKRGSGLGLYIVKGIVTLHGGRIEAHSEGAGLGARFEIWLPQVGAGVQADS